MKTTTTKKPAAKSAAKKTSAKKVSSKKVSAKKVAKKPASLSTSHSVSCDDKTWNTIQAQAKKAGMSVSAYIVSKFSK